MQLLALPDHDEFLSLAACVGVLRSVGLDQVEVGGEEFCDFWDGALEGWANRWVIDISRGEEDDGDPVGSSRE